MVDTRNPSRVVKLSRALPSISSELDTHLHELLGERTLFSVTVWTDDQALTVSNAADEDFLRNALSKVVKDWKKDDVRTVKTQQ